MKFSRSTASIFTALLVISFSCGGKKNIKQLTRPLPAGSTVAVIIDAKSNLKNVVLAKFMEAGYTVTAVNASDLYEYSDIFDISDLKRLSYKGGGPDSVLAMERTYNDAYKLHVYNYEINKAEILAEMRNKWRVQYLVILDLKNWKDVSWGRTINLATLELMWIENYPTRYNDTIESVIEHFIASFSGK